MGERSLQAHWSRAYLKRRALIGFLYSAVPTCLWSVWVFLNNDFRGVYVARLLLGVGVGGAIGVWVHSRAMALWINLHCSEEGPIGIMDGALIGAGVGFAGSFIPPLTSLIASNHPELAKSFIISAWTAAPIIGGVIGAVLTSIGRQHIDRVPTASSKE